MVAEKEYVSIVIADDDEDDRAFVKQALKAAKVPNKVVEVRDGLQLVSLLENRGNNDIDEKEPDLIFLDLNMPKVDGFNALKHIKTSLNLKSIPVYVLSTSKDKVHIERALNLGANGYYQKSARFSEIVAMVSAVCANHHQAELPQGRQAGSRNT